MSEEKCLIDPNRDCPGLSKAREVEKELKDLEARNGNDHKEFREQIREIREDSIQRGAQFTAILETMREIKDDNKAVIAALGELKPKAEAIEGLKGEVKELEGEIEDLKAKPAQKWEGMSEKFTGGIIGVIAAALGAAILWLLRNAA